MLRKRLSILSVLLAPLAGCATFPANPTFPLSQVQASQDLDAMARNPLPVSRPVLILGGFLDPGYMTTLVAADLHRAISNDPFATVTFIDCASFDQCRRHLIGKVEQQFPSNDPRYTTKVDVVAMSMGGLIARYAARPSPEAAPLKQLRIARLFTIAAPHRGALLADWPTISEMAIQMRPGSAFLRSLNTPPIAAEYHLLPYVWANDNIVGAANAAPPGQTAWWLPPIPLESPHIGSMRDPRIIADIARRLRGEPPYTIEPPAPLPPGATALGS